MLFVDYYLDVFDDGTIMMDPELKADKINTKNGDIYRAYVAHSGAVVFKKIMTKEQFDDMMPDGHS